MRIDHTNNTEGTNRDDDSDDDAIPSLFSGAIGGIIRSFLKSLRAITRIVTSITLGSLPRTRIPLHSLGQTADQLSQLLELRSHIRKSTDSQKKYPTRLSRWLHIAFVAFPEMLKSTILGTVLFTTYDGLTEVLYEIIRDRHTRAKKQSESATEIHVNDKSEKVFNYTKRLFIFPNLFISVFVGAIGGSVHGLLYYIWEAGHHRVYLWTNRELSKPIHLSSSMLKLSLCGTLASHTLSHAALFGTYHFTKQSLFYLDHLFIDRCSTTEDGTICEDEGFNPSDYKASLHDSKYADTDWSSREPWIELMSVGLAGATAGAAAELVGYYTEELESHGVRKGFMRTMKRNWPGVRYLYSSLLPSALGFLAYEFTKSL